MAGRVRVANQKPRSPHARPVPIIVPKIRITYTFGRAAEDASDRLVAAIDRLVAASNACTKTMYRLQKWALLWAFLTVLMIGVQVWVAYVR